MKEKKFTYRKYTKYAENTFIESFYWTAFHFKIKLEYMRELYEWIANPRDEISKLRSTGMKNTYWKMMREFGVCVRSRIFFSVSITLKSPLWLDGELHEISENMYSQFIQEVIHRRSILQTYFMHIPQRCFEKTTQSSSVSKMNALFSSLVKL